jgi:hypothetical protein
MIVACIALFVALGGGAYALTGSNTVQSDDLGPGAQVKAADVAGNAIKSSNIQNGQVSVLDTNKVIPSGATVTGAFDEVEDDSGGAGGAALRFSEDFYGLRAPTALTDNNINFDDTGISADAAASSEENPGCTGGIGIPTAPPGEVCIYLVGETVDNGSAFGRPIGIGTGFNQADDKGFVVTASNNVISFAELRGSWAYTAP